MDIREATERLQAIRTRLKSYLTVDPDIMPNLTARWAADAEAIDAVLAETERLRDDLATAKTVMRRDEDSLRQWEQRARESHNDLMRTVSERDRLRAALEAIRDRGQGAGGSVVVTETMLRKIAEQALSVKLKGGGE